MLCSRRARPSSLQTTVISLDLTTCADCSSCHYQSVHWGNTSACSACAQPGKCLYTTVRELVENSLDAAEDAGSLPEIDITMCACICLKASTEPRMLSSSLLLFDLLTNKACCSEEVSQKRLNSIRGISNHDRLDEELYLDHETDDAKKVF